MENEIFEKALGNANNLMSNEEFNEKMDSALNMFYNEHTKNAEDLKRFNLKLTNLRNDVKSKHEKKNFNIDGFDIVSSEDEMRDFFAFNHGVIKKTDCNNKKKYNYNEKVEKLIENATNEDVKEYLRDNFGSFQEEESIPYAAIVEQANNGSKRSDEMSLLIKAYIDTLNEYYIEKGYIERNQALTIGYDDKFVTHAFI